MAKKGGSFWDNPFGGLFDFNRDGREDFSEQWLALKIFEECTKHNSDTDDGYHYSSGRIGRSSIAQNRYEWRLYCEDGCDVGVDPEDFETAEEYEEALAEARSQWRNDCEYGSDVNIDPEDFDTEEEYTEALEAARASKQRQITINLWVEIPGMEALSAINPKDYPNRRMYEAAYRLCDVRQGTAYISEDSSADAEIEKCQFILNSDTVAAKYLTVYKGFLYAQAVKEHFNLPINIPDEDESVITYFDDFIREVAEEDSKLAVEIWGWCIKQFGPYTQYMYDHRTLYNFTMCSVDEYPDEFLNVAAQVIGNDPEFCDGLLTKSKDFPCCCSPIIIRALKNGLVKEASLMFIAAILNPAGRGKDIEELIDRIISGCSDWEEVETMESFQKHILPVIEKIAHKRIKRLYPKFADKVTSYIHSVERSSNRYQYSRCHAWRRNCVDGSEYDIDPLDYETEAEYNQAIYDEKYAWRQWAAIDARKYGIDPTAFETEEAFSTAVDNARQEELQKRRGKQTQQQSRNARYADPLAKTDKAVYTFCGVLFENGATIYFYRTSDESITVGDYVVVPVGRDEKEIIAEVVTVQKHRRATAPYPVDKAKLWLSALVSKAQDIVDMSDLSDKLEYIIASRGDAIMAKKKELSFSRFLKRFSTEKACADYLYQIKWPEGFVCPKCGCREHYPVQGYGRYQCKYCRHQTSLTANTVMHRTHLPLTKWFWAIYLVACDKRGISALALSGKIEVCYETAWYMLRRIRGAMEMRDQQYYLEGIVEFDDSYFGAKIKGKEGRGAGNQPVFVAVSKDEKGHPVYLKMHTADNIQRPSVGSFVRENIKPGSTVQTDGFRSYRQPLAQGGYIHEYQNFNADGELLKWLHSIIGNAKAFINGTYHGTSTKHMQMYLSEFCYRFNRRKFHGAIFDRLLVAIAR